MSSHLRRSKYKPHSASLSEEEIDKKLTAYFATHPVLTRSNMQSLLLFYPKHGQQTDSSSKGTRKLTEYRQTHTAYLCTNSGAL